MLSSVKSSTNLMIFCANWEGAVQDLLTPDKAIDGRVLSLVFGGKEACSEICQEHIVHRVASASVGVPIMSSDYCMTNICLSSRQTHIIRADRAMQKVGHLKLFEQEGKTVLEKRVGSDVDCHEHYATALLSPLSKLTSALCYSANALDMAKSVAYVCRTNCTDKEHIPRC